jgi:hypothetical protein
MTEKMKTARAAEPARLSIEYLPLRRIRPLPRNAKQHDLEAIIASISEFGFLDPIGINKRTGHDLDGNGRLEALQEMERRGLPPPRGIVAGRNGWEAPTVAGISLDAAREARAALALNRTNELGGFDEQLLLEILRECEQEGGLEATGYTPDFINSLMMRLDPPAAAPAAAAPAVSLDLVSAPPSQVRMVQLFYTAETQPVLLSRAADLIDAGAVLDDAGAPVRDLSELVFALIRNAHAQLETGADR